MTTFYSISVSVTFWGWYGTRTGHTDIWIDRSFSGDIISDSLCLKIFAKMNISKNALETRHNVSEFQTQRYFVVCKQFLLYNLLFYIDQEPPIKICATSFASFMLQFFHVKDNSFLRNLKKCSDIKIQLK